MSLFTLEDSVLIFQLLNYQITHLPNSRLHQSCLDRKREQNSRNRWHNGLALAFKNYQLPIMAITNSSYPPFFVSKNLHGTYNRCCHVSQSTLLHYVCSNDVSLCDKIVQ